MYIRNIFYTFYFTFLLVLGFNLIQINPKHYWEAYTITQVFREQEDLEEKSEQFFLCKRIFPSPFFNAAKIWHIYEKKIFNASHHSDLQDIFHTIPARNGSFTVEGEFMHRIFKSLTVSISFGKLFCLDSSLVPLILIYV